MKIQLLIKLCREDYSLFESIDFFKVNDTVCKSQGELVNSLCEILKLLNGEMQGITMELKTYHKDPYSVCYNLKRNIKRTQDYNHEKLTVRELEVLDLIMQGYTNKKISEMLFLSFETIRSHRKNILKKTGQKNTAALINYYHQTFFDK